jgi:hypothetical protein
MLQYEAIELRAPIVEFAREVQVYETHSKVHIGNIREVANWHWHHRHPLPVSVVGRRGKLLGFP